MFKEKQKWMFVSGLHDITYLYSGITFSPQIIRTNEDIKMSNTTPSSQPNITVSFNPTSKKYGMSFDNRIGKNVNEMYDNYAYGEDVRCVIRSFARDQSGVKGRQICDSLLESIESYLKINAYTLFITGISVDQYSFVQPKEIYYDQEKRLYGYEMMFDLTVTNQWTNEPAAGAQPCYPLSGISLSLSGSSNMYVNL